MTQKTKTAVAKNCIMLHGETINPGDKFTASVDEVDELLADGFAVTPAEAKKQREVVATAPAAEKAPA